MLFYPTAIGSEPQDPKLDSYEHWTRVMCGHAGANLVRFFDCEFYLSACLGVRLVSTHQSLTCERRQVPLVASNRVGKELMNTFYGGSFIAGPTGDIRVQVSAALMCQILRILAVFSACATFLCVLVSNNLLVMCRSARRQRGT